MIERPQLAQHALFGGLTPEQVALVLPHLQVEHFAAAEMVIREGEKGDRLFFIGSGRVEVFCGEYPQVHLAELGEGDAFGEMELIDTQPRSASVRALTVLHTYSLKSHDLHAVAQEAPNIFTMIVLNLARELSRRLRLMNSRLR